MVRKVENFLGQLVVGPPVCAVAVGVILPAILHAMVEDGRRQRVRLVAKQTAAVEARIRGKVLDIVALVLVIVGGEWRVQCWLLDVLSVRGARRLWLRRLTRVLQVHSAGLAKGAHASSRLRGSRRGHGETVREVKCSGRCARRPTGHMERGRPRLCLMVEEKVDFRSMRRRAHSIPASAPCPGRSGGEGAAGRGVRFCHLRK